MTVTTLTYIHNLLKEEANKREMALKWIRESYVKAMDDEQPNVKTLEEQKEVARIKFNEANDALRDFESKEW